MLENLASRHELLALAILGLGLIVARMASAAVGGILGFVDRRTARLAVAEKSFVSPGLIGLSRAVVFWLFIILAVSLSLRLLGVGGIATALNSVIAFVPQLLVAFAIIVGGHLVGLLSSHLVANLNDELSTQSLGPRLLYGAIVVVAIVMGLQHIDVDISFVTQLLLILVAVVSGGLMLAFALGARRHVANLLARDALARLKVGDQIRVDELEGSIVEIYSTGLDIATDSGIASIPAARLVEVAVLRKSSGEGGD